ncbi:MAG: Translation initiation factor 2 subunit beta [Methanocella sp. PtaU1.Bin125]|nr:MAG: Translation initiation factor 2 subunit beta [Methanocella sp. PtaU1.Bin125]
MDYDDLLNRGKSGLPENVETRGRFEVPAARVLQQGKKTTVINFGDICDSLNREQDTVAKYLLRELGTAGSRREGRLTLNGAFTADSVNAVIKKYVESYVMCRECHLPDTKLQKEGRRTFIRCEACGARYGVD